MTSSCLFSTSQSQDKHLTDFSQGDPEARLRVDENNQKQPSDEDDHIETDCLNEKQKLDGSTSDCSEVSWNPKNEKFHVKPSPSIHVSFKTSKTFTSKQSIADLRKESKSLLAIKNNPLIPSGLNQAISHSDDINSTATIFELCWDDRQRVGQLIGELASSQEKLYELEDQLEQSEKKQTKYKQKCSDLMKRVDVVGEKSHRLQNEKSQMKEKHLESLTVLQNKIITISEQFEAAAREIQRLTIENQQIKMETAATRANTSTLETKAKDTEEINLRTKVLLDTAIKREKSFKSQLKELSANLEQKGREEQDRKKVVKDLEKRLALAEKQLEKTRAELQNVRLNNCSSSSDTSHSRTEEITKLPEPKVKTPIASPRGRRIDNQTIDQNQKEEAILQDLFFRF